MKSNPWMSLLMAALFVSAAGTAYLAYKYLRSVYHLRQLQEALGTVKWQMTLFKGFVDDTVTFGQRNNVVIPPLANAGSVMTSNPPAARPPGN